MPSSRRGLTRAEVLVLIAIVVLLISIVLPTVNRLRQREIGTRCSSNLRQIGQAILLYSNDNRGAYPRTRTSKGPVRVPTWGTRAAATQPFGDDGPEENDVTAAVFLLLRTQEITAEVFVCPSSGVTRDEFEGKRPIDRSNFTDWRKNLSYSNHNPYDDDSMTGKKRWPPRHMGAEFAIMADRNPGDSKSGNSPNHKGEGQNVLYADGHVAWENNPFVGADRDNIFTTQDGKIAASPVNQDDSILLPAD